MKWEGKDDEIGKGRVKGEGKDEGRGKGKERLREEVTER